METTDSLMTRSRVRSGGVQMQLVAAEAAANAAVLRGVPAMTPGAAALLQEQLLCPITQARNQWRMV